MIACMSSIKYASYIINIPGMVEFPARLAPGRAIPHHAAMRADRSDPEWLVEWPGRVMETGNQPGQWSPPLDILEHAETIEIRIDVAGVPAELPSITVRRSTLTIEGSKAALCGQARRSMSPSGPPAASPARSRCESRSMPAPFAPRLRDGELRIVVPRMAERRGRRHPRADRAHA